VKKVIIPIVVLVAIFAALVFTTNITPISAITDNPTKYHDIEVTIMGNITGRIAYQNEVFSQVTDGTGSIMVHTQGEAPALGSKVVVKRLPESMVKVGPYEFGVIIQASEVRAPYPWERLELSVR
jgi:hypothetical protein